MRKACLLLIFLIVSMGIVFPPSFFAATDQKKKTRLPAPPITVPRTDTSARLALVIGNSTYQFSPLKNPVNDASDIAAALKELRSKRVQFCKLNPFLWDPMQAGLKPAGHKESKLQTCSCSEVVPAGLLPQGAGSQPAFAN